MKKNNGQFKKGQIPHNKGKKWEEYMSAEAIENIKKTIFKKGNKPHNTKYNGYERISKEGYIYVRVSESKFVLKHRKIWEEHHGEIPKGHIIIFKDNDKQNFDIDNLECISRRENRYRNRFSPNYPREIQALEYQRHLLNLKLKQLKK